jgi:hypothetical protein
MIWRVFSQLVASLRAGVYGCSSGCAFGRKDWGLVGVRGIQLGYVFTSDTMDKEYEFPYFHFKTCCIFSSFTCLSVVSVSVFGFYVLALAPFPRFDSLSRI